jgi:hypothetical protein
MSADLQEMVATIADIQRREAARKVEREDLAAANRERMRQWSPEFYRLCEQLKAKGMFGRVVQFEVTK